MVNFFAKEKYVLYCEHLQLLLRLELKLKKIHRVLEFNQSEWLKPYIKFNTQKRIEAEKKWRQRWKSTVQINEQCCTWESYGILEKYNRSKTWKQQKRLFKMYMVIKLHVTQNI